MSGNVVVALSAVEKAKSFNADKKEDGEARLAAHFALRNAKQVVYHCGLGKYLRWSGSCWRVDETGLTYHEIQRSVEVDAPMDDAIAVRRNRKWTTTAGVAEFVKRRPEIARSAAAFDQHKLLLQTPAGIVNLQSGEELAPAADLLITRCTSCSPAMRGVRPRVWLRTLLQCFKGNRRMVRYLQRLFGYALVGDKREHVIVFFWGSGGNGKSTIVETISAVLGDYAKTSAMETFEQAVGDRHSNEIARLANVRFVAASENSHARRVNLELLKRLSGADTIAARFLYKEAFEYKPEFLLVLLSNHKPRLPAVDDGFGRRLHFLPFSVRFNPPDLDLPDRLRAEYPAILRWMIDGALMWSRDRLSPPAEVVAATRSYLQQQDLVGQFLDERTRPCTVGAGVLLNDVVMAFTSWANERGSPHLSNRALSDDLERRGFEIRKGNKGLKVFRLILVGQDSLPIGVTEVTE